MVRFHLQQHSVVHLRQGLLACSHVLLRCVTDSVMEFESAFTAVAKQSSSKAHLTALEKLMVGGPIMANCCEFEDSVTLPLRLGFWQHSILSGCMWPHNPRDPVVDSVMSGLQVKHA